MTIFSDTLYKLSAINVGWMMLIRFCEILEDFIVISYRD